jgi:ketosteroid isomerase-like protein
MVGLRILLAFTAVLLALPRSSTAQAATPQTATQSGTQTTTQTATQTATQSGIQTATQSGVQTGTESGTQASPQSSTAATHFHQLIPLPPHAPVTPGQITLIGLESRFAQDVADRGGKGFSSWFADDGVTLSNGQPPVRGRASIAAIATWNPKEYTLTWVAEGADMALASDMGYTWGHYEGRATDKSGHQSSQTGRYLTIWKKQTNGAWKVSLEASAQDSAGSAAIPMP